VRAIRYLPFLFLLAACQTAPANVSEAIGAGYASLTTVAHDVHDAKTSGLITEAKAGELKAQLQAAKNNLDQASQAYAANDPDLATSRLEASRIVLRTVIQVLKDNGHG